MAVPAFRAAGCDKSGMAQPALFSDDVRTILAGTLRFWTGLLMNTINLDTEAKIGNAPKEIRARLNAVLRRIGDAARRSGRDPSGVTLVAVAKTFPVEAILPLIEAGHRVFGENRVQEARAKWPPLKAQWPEIELHLIGPLQSNKARDAVALFDVIQSVDRPKIAEVLAREMRESGRRPKLFVQVNTGEEPQKAGVAPGEAGEFVRRCHDVWGLDIAGLMCIPPEHEEPALHFALLAKLRDELGLRELSMGMSGDFETAVEFDATYVRVGSAIFGTR
jgi:pyridoxal phosphate enzyme (YggS family)